MGVAAAIGGGGYYNHARWRYSVVAGGGGPSPADSNSALGVAAAIGGGRSNIASNGYATVGGGFQNTASGNRANVSGGESNTASNTYCTVGGGADNNASGYCSVISGGCLVRADGEHSAVGGGSNNVAAGLGSTVPGGMDNLAEGDYTVAMGRQAKAVNDGSFVWADGSGQDFATTSDNQFLIRAQGGVGIGTNHPQAQLDVAGNVKCSGVQEVSDARLKTDIQPIYDALCKIERLQGVCFRWNDHAESVGATPGDKQIGVVAQDVEQVFPELVSTPENGYKSVDYTKLTAVLIEAVKELRAQNEKMQAEINELRSSR